MDYDFRDREREKILLQKLLSRYVFLIRILVPPSVCGQTNQMKADKGLGLRAPGLPIGILGSSYTVLGERVYAELVRAQGLGYADGAR